MNAPNTIAGVRLLASPGLVVLASAGDEAFFLILFLILEATDWLDGRLAVALKQQTVFGARLDTAADMAMYTALLVGLALLEGDVFLREWPWMAPAVCGYAVSWVLSLIKFRRIPSYHTWSAKVSWLLALVAAVALLTWGDVLFLRLAAGTVALANVEAIALTVLLDTPRSNVVSVFSVRGAGSS